MPIKRKIPILMLLANALVLASPALADNRTADATPAPAAGVLAADHSDTCDDRPVCGGEEAKVASELVRQDAPAACYRWYFLQWDSFWWFGNNNWHHYYRPVVCYNGSVITGRDQSSHWQETHGHYHPSGVSHHVVAGCTGCVRIQLKGIGNFRWAWGGVERSFSRCANLTVYGNGAWSSWYGC